MDKYLTSLAQYLLSQEPQGISKVRLAKLIYFTHKNLVKEKLSKSLELGFVRMPLGPVPIRFKELTNDSNIVMKQMATGLSYNKQVYSLMKDVDTKNSIFFSVQKIYKKLNKLSTSELVEMSHKEPSWISHVNGEEYFLGQDDLALNLPIIQDSKIEQEIDNQFLQAKLIEGMLDDIVEESTRLEYPVKSS